MTRFRTQREVSEYFGKNPNDRSFISRNIKKGKIIKEDGWYTIVDYKEDIKRVASSNEVDIDKVVYDLQKEVERLRKENKELKEKSDNKEVWLLDIDNLKYLMDMLQRRNMFIQAVIKDFYDSNIGKYDREWAIEEVYKKYKFEENPTDDDEIMYILEIISDNEKKS